MHQNSTTDLAFQTDANFIYNLCTSTSFLKENDMADYYENEESQQNQKTKFYGTIDENMSLMDIFQNLAMNQQHGWLTLQSSEKEIYFYSDNIHAADIFKLWCGIMQT